MTFSTVTAAHKKLTELKLTTAKYQTVVSYLNKKYTPEAAFGLVKRPWELRYENLDQLVLQDAYNYVGSKHHLSIPILVESEKNIPFNRRICKSLWSRHNDYLRKYKKGMTVEEILKKSGHI